MHFKNLQKFKKKTQDYFKLLWEFFKGLFPIVSLLLRFLKDLSRKINFYEYLFLIFLAVSGYLFSRGFLGYELNLAPQGAYYHTIVSDDFFWFFLFHFTAFLPFLVEIYYPVCKSREFRLAFFLRLAGLLGITILYFLSWLNPSRIAPVKEAKFTLCFYLFGLNLVALWTSGVLGMVRYAQRSHITSSV